MRVVWWQKQPVTEQATILCTLAWCYGFALLCTYSRSVGWQQYRRGVKGGAM